MLKSKVMLIGLALLLATFFIHGDVFANQNTDNSSSTVQSGTVAPSFVLNGVGGVPRTLADFAGKYVVLEWTDFDCAEVKAGYKSGLTPKMQTWFRDHGAVWLSVLSPEAGSYSKDAMRELRTRLAKEKSVAADCLLDYGGQTSRLYQVTKVPTLCLIDPNGKLIWCGPADKFPGTAGDNVGTTYLQVAFEASVAGKKLPDAPELLGCLVR